MLEDSLEERVEKSGGLLSDSEKTEGEMKEGETEENKVPNKLFPPSKYKRPNWFGHADKKISLYPLYPLYFRLIFFQH